MPRCTPALAALAAAASMAARTSALTFSSVFGSHMVLQRDKPAMLWGFDTAGNEVTTSFLGLQLHSTAGADGIWRQALPVTAAGPTAYNITISSSTGTATLSDVLFGMVVIVGGQSNAQFSVAAAFNASAEIAAANYPLLRVFTVGQGTQSPTPLTDLKTIEQTWAVITPASIGNGEFTFFSAMGYFFARDVHEATGVPIGIISNNWGGTCLENWVEPGVSAACGLPGHVPALYYAMISPYLVGPMAVEAFTWSQGECNADANTTAYYACAFAPFLDSWRTLFGAPDAFFAFELLPAYISDSTFSPASLPYERAAQLTGLAAKGANVVVANGMDLGDPQAPHGSVHPRNKQAVGRRIADAAMNLVFKAGTPYLNPTYAGAAAVTYGTELNVTVTFRAETVAGGLVVVPSLCPVAQGVPQAECMWLEVQTADGVWRNTTASVAAGGGGTAIVLSVTGGVPAGMLANATRGCFSPWPVVTVYSAAGQPALPWAPTAVDSVVALAVSSAEAD